MSRESFSIDFTKLFSSYPKEVGKKKRMEFRADIVYFQIIRDYMKRNGLECSLQKALQEIIREKYAQMLLDDLCKQKPELINELEKAKNLREFVDVLHNIAPNESRLDIISSATEELYKTYRLDAIRKRKYASFY